MSARACLGCGRLIASGSRCAACRAALDRARGSRQERGYDAAHDAERRRWAPLVEAGAAGCARCGLPIDPGEAWDLGHTADRSTWRGPEHAGCNRATAGRNGTATNAPRRQRW